MVSLKDRAESLCVQRLKALADPTRFRVVKALSKEPMKVGQLERRLRIEQSLLSHHLKILREAELVRGERVGKSICYSVAREFHVNDEDEGIDLECCKLVF